MSSISKRYHFGISRHPISEEQAKRIKALAKEHGVDWFIADIPGVGLQSWFSCDDVSPAANGRTARLVHEALTVEGLDLALGFRR